MNELQICNTATTYLKTHLRKPGANRTLCNRHVIVPNMGDEDSQLNSVECIICRRAMYKILNISSPQTP